MTNEEFHNWLNGYLTMTDETYLDEQQVRIIENHANLSFAITKHLDLEIKALIKYLKQEINRNKKINISPLRDGTFRTLLIQS